MSTSTLTSLAILNVHVNDEKDYLDYLRPFVFQVFVDQKPELITNDLISNLIHEQFGLKIPNKTVEIVLKRISRENVIEKRNHVYRISGEVPDPQITIQTSEAQHQIDSVVAGLMQFSEKGVKPFSSFQDAVTAICSFLSRFDVTCLRAYLFNSAIPKLEGAHKTDVVQVSEYVQFLQRTDPERFEDFLVLVQGHMLANALLCPDLENVRQTYHEVIFFLDTPLLIPLLGLEDESRQTALQELISSLKKLGGEIAAFSHTCDELNSVIRSSAFHLGRSERRSPIIYEARKRGTSKADLIRIAATIENRLNKLGVEIFDTPQYRDTFQIDENIFEQVLSEGLYYKNPQAKVFDISSVRSIYAIRGNASARSLEKSRAVLVTSNAAYAKAAWDYGKKHESSRDVSTVITEFSLANMAWLKAPWEAPEIPRTQLLAFCYAALKPSIQLLNKFISEIDKLEREGDISEREHQLLRSSTFVEDELMHLTLGEDTALTGETVIQTLDRVVTEIRKEDAAKIDEVEDAHKETQTNFSSQVAQNKNIRDNIHRRCQRNAKLISWTVTCFIATIFIAGIYSEIGISSPLPTGSRILFVCSAVYVLISAGNIFFNFNFLIFHKKLQEQLLKWFLLREEKTIGVNLSEFYKD